ncbi:MAG: hypothetical protein R3253_04740 [Longimicrobiales bacterium]|nr:hypothetical protein [Longimicrobiales bacterium]
MYKSLLFLHWKQIRHVLALLVIASFTLPLMAVNGLGTIPGMEGAGQDAYWFVTRFQAWLIFFPLLAAGVGITLALSAWNWDHQLNHVYALSLPITRWEYTLGKMLAGATLVVLPAVGLWLGSHVAVASVELPEGINAYPNQLAVRFLFAALLAYSAFFAAAAGTVKTTLWLVGGILTFIVLGSIANDVMAQYVVYFSRVHVVEAVMTWMAYAPGPFEVFTGSWSLIDV